MQDIPLSEVVYFWIHRAHSRSKDYSKKVIREAGIDLTVDQWVLIKKLGESPGMSQVELANATFKDPAAILRILQILRRKNLVCRNQRQGDKRTYELFLSQEGKSLIRKITPLIQGVREVGLSGLTEEETETARRLMRKIYQNFDRQMTG